MHLFIFGAACSANPEDFIGINFQAGEPKHPSELLASLAGDRDVEALQHDLALLVQMPRDIRLKAVGHADSIECRGAECDQLSLRRATALHDWMIANGVDSNRLGPPVGFGSSSPIDDDTTSSGRDRNRRAYISIEGLGSAGQES